MFDPGALRFSRSFSNKVMVSLKVLASRSVGAGAARAVERRTATAVMVVKNFMIVSDWYWVMTGM